jgi:hypothetical protein
MDTVTVTRASRAILILMRFSIRWLLLVVAYVSLASAAIATQSYRLADLVWALTLIVISYVGLLAFVATGKRQVVALGFVVVAFIHIVGLLVLPSQMPVIQLFDFIGYDVEASGWVSEPDRPVAGAQRFFVTTGRIMPIVYTANAIGTLASGLVGCLLGSLAFKHGRQE